ncbi:MAG TPA: AAA family ATPase, partial [Candidatus Saccharimonadales bacterium]|nr:AAA family ATPase [Candidatus Saccharimonadales bacterium]
RYDAQENAIVNHLMDYMAEEFLNSGVSVVYDTNALRESHRRRLCEMARQHRAAYMLIWIQIDMESAFMRTQGRDRRTTDDRYAEPQTRQTFDRQLAAMQNPQGEEYLVISGKHTFNTQKSSIISRLYQKGLIGSQEVQANVTKPELVNLIPNFASQVHLGRRNIKVD